MLALIDQLCLIHANGLSPEACLWVVNSGDEEYSGLSPECTFEADFRLRLERDLRLRGYLGQRGPRWPEKPAMQQLARGFAKLDMRIAWRGQAGYPARLARRMENDAPPWVLLGGTANRLMLPSCGMIGSRETPPTYLAAARRLARALAEAGIAVVSGMAPGADSMAHQGAIEAGATAAGTIAIPARGLMQVNLNSCQLGRMTAIGLGRPLAPFSAGLAIRRNDIIAACGDVLVLIASGLVGGSSYAVAWALRNKVPIFCLESGVATPAANRHLLRGNRAHSLKLHESSDAWLARILPAIAGRMRGGKNKIARHRASAEHRQAGWLDPMDLPAD